MYWEDTWDFKDSIEHEIKYAGKYGAKGEKRAKKQKPTPEQIKKQNQINREKSVRRLIKQNFKRNDLWCTLKYPAGTRRTVEEVKRDVSNFLKALGRIYQKRGQPLKWIKRLEIGEQGGIHIHILINRLQEGDTDILVQEKWQQGRVNYTNVYDQGGYKSLAEYIVKQPNDEEYEQLSLFDAGERKILTSYSTSRNLKRPEPQRKTYTRRTVRRIVDKGPTPTPGYYIDQDSVLSGVNRYTGMSYYQYIEYRINQNNREDDGDAGCRCLHRDEHTGTGKRSGKDHVHDENSAKERKRARERPTGGTV